MIDILNKMYSDGSLRKLYEAGFVTQRALTYRIVYINYLELKEKNVKTDAAATKLSTTYSITKRTVYKIIKTFKNDKDRNTDTNKG